VLLIYLGEGTLIGGLGLLLGLLLGQGLARLMTQTERFLVFTQEAISATLSPAALHYGLIGVALCLLALLLPAFLTGKHTIVSLRTSRSRQSGRTFMQRTFLDFLLLIPPFYGLYLLQQQGTIGSGDTVFDNPLLFLVPALFCLAFSLLFLRLFPAFLSLPLWLWERQLSIPNLLTLRQLARATIQYSGPLLLLCLTLSLATFTASMAQTLDAHLTDELYYQTGADLNLAQLGEPIPVPEGADPESLGFSFLPVEDHLVIAGVQTATRVGRYRANVSIGGQQSSGQLMGLDRLDFPQAAFFRDDFAAEPLIGLLNRLATRRNGLLVNQHFLQQRSLAVGDPLLLTVNTGSKFAEIPFIIVGTFDLFPTWYPDEGALFIGHLAYMHEKMDGTFPYHVWLATDGATSAEQIVSQVRQRGFTVVTAQDARAQVAAARTQPARQGVFGLLSVGFFAAALLTVLGYLVFAVVGFQRRVVELGMLRALGLSTQQMVRHLASEQAVLIFMGIGVGTLIGVVANRLFIPFLQVGAGRTAQVPPFVVQIAWEQLLTIYGIFGIMLLTAIGVLGWFLTRLKLFEAVKLGETV
jgi:putative ABC transport system permease protein